MLRSKLFRESREKDRPKNRSMLYLSSGIEIEKSRPSGSLVCSLDGGMEDRRTKSFVESTSRRYFFNLGAN
jgi:hypothetical protein